jgi:predicted phage replisome organizer
MFDDEKIRLIEAMPKGIMVIYVWMRLLVQAGRTNARGCIYLNEDIPYTAKMLAALFGKPLEVIKYSLKILCDFKMIEIDSSNIIKIKNWGKHQNVEGMERVREQSRKRIADHSEKKKQIKQDPEENTEKIKEINNSNSCIYADKSCDNNLKIIKTDSNVIVNDSNVTVTEQNKKENKNKKEREKKDKDTEKENANIFHDVEDKNLICDEYNKSLICDQEENRASLFELHNNTKSETAEEEGINPNVLDLMPYHEKIIGKAGSYNYVALKSAIEIHGEKWIKMAMNVGSEKNCTDIKYASGVLINRRRNWVSRGT